MKTLSSWFCLSASLFLLADVSAEHGEGKLLRTAQNTTVKNGRRLDQTIAGGSVVAGEDYPFFALLFGASGSDKAYFCGGVLIKSDAVLTAASCFNNRNRMSFVRLGGDDYLGGEEIEVDEIIINPRYRNNGGILEYDFAVLKLKEDAVTKPVDINLTPEFPALTGTPLETLGYGDVGESTNLKQVDLEYVSFGACQADFFPDISQNLHLCAIGEEPNSGPCEGDGGGPLLYDDDLLVGITSFGSDCGSGGVDVYSKVADNIYWIFTQAGLPIPTPEPTKAPTPAPTKHQPTRPPIHHYPTHPSEDYPTPPVKPTDDYPCTTLERIQNFGNRMFNLAEEAEGMAKRFFAPGNDPQ